MRDEQNEKNLWIRQQEIRTSVTLCSGIFLQKMVLLFDDQSGNVKTNDDFLGMCVRMCVVLHTYGLFVHFKVTTEFHYQFFMHYNYMTHT